MRHNLEHKSLPGIKFCSVPADQFRDSVVRHRQANPVKTHFQIRAGSFSIALDEIWIDYSGSKRMGEEESLSHLYPASDQR